MKSKWLNKTYDHAIAFLLWICLGLILTLFCLNQKILPVIAQTSLMVQTEIEPSQIEPQADQLYSSGQFNQAIKIWQQVFQLYQTRKDILNQARVLNNLSLAYQQLGQWSLAKDAIAQSLELLQTSHLSNSQAQLDIQAQALNNQGSLLMAIGQTESAFLVWQQTTTIYTKAGDDHGKIRSLINQSQALKALGMYQRSLTVINEAKQLLDQQPDTLLKVVGLNSLGNTWRLIGDFQQSQQILQQSLRIAEQLKSSQELALVLLSLGNTNRSQQNYQLALDFYQRAASISPDKITQIQAQLNQLSLLVETQQWLDANLLWPQIQPQIGNLPPSQAGIYAQINFARSLIKLKQAVKIDLDWSIIAQIVAESLQQAKSLGDERSQSYALGILAEVYTQTQQWSIAQDLTQQALLLAQSINATDIAYRWQWQLGKLLKTQGYLQEALSAYHQAVNTLKSLRSDLATTNQDIQFSFKESVEPVYREFVSLLLQPSLRPTQQNLLQARNLLESLQLAELDNFFQASCLETKTVQIEQVDPQTAVIYPIILADRLELIVSLPNQPLHHYTTVLPQIEIDNVVEKFRRDLIIPSHRGISHFSQQLYNWLIRPIEPDFANSDIKTLVFVLDGVLRNIPMAALHDGKQYLIEKYSIALAPGLQLIDPKKLPRNHLRVLIAGLTQARSGFPALENVAQELKAIKSKIPTSKVLLDQDFTSANLQSEIKSNFFPIVHIATHGQFSSIAAETFILAWDHRIGVEQLDQLLQLGEKDQQQAIELLVLSACETATGDKRAALGIAGMAIRSGARSTLATLWAISDEATLKLMDNFYQQLTKTKDNSQLDAHLTKAEALRRAQLSLLHNPRYQHPIYWAPFILVGNWL